MYNKILFDFDLIMVQISVGNIFENSSIFSLIQMC